MSSFSSYLYTTEVGYWQLIQITTGRLLGGRYRLERVLGEGGMGIVYKATDQEVQGETFAVKVLLPEIRARPEALELLREEVRKTRSLAHPNIVGVYSLNIDRADVFILMEYLGCCARLCPRSQCDSW